MRDFDLVKIGWSAANGFMFGVLGINDDYLFSIESGYKSFFSVSFCFYRKYIYKSWED